MFSAERDQSFFHQLKESGCEEERQAEPEGQARRTARVQAQDEDDTR